MTLDFAGHDALVTGAGASEQPAAAWAEASDRTGEQVPASGAAQGSNEVGQALAARR